MAEDATTMLADVARYYASKLEAHGTRAASIGTAKPGRRCALTSWCALSMRRTHFDQRSRLWLWGSTGLPRCAWLQN